MSRKTGGTGRRPVSGSLCFNRLNSMRFAGTIKAGNTVCLTCEQVFRGYAAARLYSACNDSISSFTEMIFLIR